ncbi:hypothetical protein ACCD03_08615 [Ralstonia sp. Ralssp135]
MLANPNLRALIRITPMHWHGKLNLGSGSQPQYHERPNKAMR